MACGTRHHLNLSSLPEVAGDAALLVNPYNIGNHCRYADKQLIQVDRTFPLLVSPESNLSAG